VDIKEKLKKLPSNPGCYLMKDEDGIIIYVGKAKNLKSRVSSYFTGIHNLKTAKMVSKIIDFDFFLTNSEKESLILEMNLIKKHMPKYNVIFKDDKTYPYIEVIKAKPPLIKVVRIKMKKNDGRIIFGPFVNSYSARVTARFLELLFPMGKVEKVPNFYEEIGLEIESDISNNYSKQLNKIINFLKGDVKQIVDRLKYHMELASFNLAFEKAANLRDKIEHILITTQKQIINIKDFKSKDIVGFFYDDEKIGVHISSMVNGETILRKKDVFSYVGDPIEFFLSYLNQFYDGIYPQEVLIDKDYFREEDVKSFNFFAIPQKGNKREMVLLAKKNAEILLKYSSELYKNKRENKLLGLEKLRKILNLEKMNLIEVFDNSQLFGTAAISAMIVYENGEFNKKKYRKYNLKSPTNDDYKGLEEVIYRRYYRLMIEKKKMPDVIMVDGGKGHVKVAENVLKNFGLNILVVGLKKDDKHNLESLVMLNKDINIKDEKQVFQILAEISAEIHRFAITFHRNLRTKIAKSSIFDNLKQIGEKTKFTLLKNFDSFDEILNANDDVFLKMGINEKKMKQIKKVVKDAVNSQKL